jgi:hypothetical protein
MPKAVALRVEPLEIEALIWRRRCGSNSLNF